jgi:hypothetical protein
MPIHPDRRDTGGPRPCHVELNGITDEDRLLWSDPGEAQRFTENRWIWFCHAEFFGDQDEVDEAIDSEEFEFCPLHLGWSVRHDPDRASGLGIVTREGLSHHGKDLINPGKQA